MVKFSRTTLFLSAAGTIGGLSVLVKQYVGGRSFNENVSLAGKTCVVTGANSGIGFEVAKDFAKRGAKVILACRDMEKAEQARSDIIAATFNKNVHVKDLNLASFDSIRKFATDMNNNQSRIDILVNNAGVMRTPKSYTEDGLEMQMGVNHFGHFLLTNLLEDKLKTSAPSRVVTVSSIAHERGEIKFDDLNSAKGYDPGFAYCQSKLANVMFTRELAKRWEGSGVTTYAVHPGVVWTNLARHMSIGKSSFSNFTLGPFLWVLLKSPLQGAQTILYCALSPDLKNVSGRYYA